MNNKKRLKTRHDGGNSPFSRFILQSYFNRQLLLFILPFAAVSVCENGDAEFFTVLKPDRRSFRGAGERRGGVYGYSAEAEAERLPILPFLSWRWRMKKKMKRRTSRRPAPDSAPDSGSPGVQRRADHHVPHSRGFVLLIIFNPASQIHSGNAGGHMA